MLLPRLLYAVFVVSSENATVAELATTLQADLSQLQAAASFACRLGWAKKLIDPASILQETVVPASPRNSMIDEDISHANLGSKLFTDADTVQPDYLGMESNQAGFGVGRAAFMVDANITSYLMMGSVSPGLFLLLFLFAVILQNSCGIISFYS